MKTKDVSILSLLILPALSILMLCSACGKGASSPNATTVVPRALSLTNSKLKPLSEVSAEQGCDALLSFVNEYRKTYLPDVELTIDDLSQDQNCVLYEEADYVSSNVQATFKNSKISLTLSFGYVMYWDAHQNFTKSLTYINRIVKGHPASGFLANPGDQLLGENIVHFKMTMDAWAELSSKAAIVLDRPYRDYVAAVLKTYGTGTDKELANSPGLQVELIPSATNPSQGQVNFVAVDTSYFKDMKSATVTGPSFLNCLDIACLNDGITYKIAGTKITLWSKVIRGVNASDKKWLLYNTFIEKADIQ